LRETTTQNKNSPKRGKKIIDSEAQTVDRKRQDGV
jgi:hypothetical protein